MNGESRSSSDGSERGRDRADVEGCGDLSASEQEVEGRAGARDGDRDPHKVVVVGEATSRALDCKRDVERSKAHDEERKRHGSPADELEAVTLLQGKEAPMALSRAGYFAVEGFAIQLFDPMGTREIETVFEPRLDPSERIRVTCPPAPEVGN